MQTESKSKMQITANVAVWTTRNNMVHSILLHALADFRGSLAHYTKFVSPKLIVPFHIAKRLLIIMWTYLFNNLSMFD